MKETLRYFSFLLLITLCSSSAPGFAAQMSKDEIKIQYLIQAVENSNAVFIRNNTNHTSKEAAKHLRYKLKMAKKSFWFFNSNINITIDNFINKIASKSSFSGKNYYMKLKDGSIVTTKSWLLKALEESKL